MEIDLEEIKNNNNNLEFMLKAVKEKGKNLELASEEIKNNKEVVIEALKQDGESLEFASDKLKAAKENGIQVFIEDSYDTCKELLENGIKSILMTTKMNQDIHQGNIVRVKNWKEIYEEILKIENEM